MPQKKAYILGGCFFLIIGLVFFAFGCIMLKEQLTINKYVAVEAVIVDHYSWEEKDSNGFDETVYNDIVEYEVNGITYRKGCDYGGYTREPDNIGQTRTVYYNRDNPADVIFKSEARVALIVGCFIAMALGAFMFILLLYKGIKGIE